LRDRSDRSASPGQKWYSPYHPFGLCGLPSHVSDGYRGLILKGKAVGARSSPFTTRNNFIFTYIQNEYHNAQAGLPVGKAIVVTDWWRVDCYRIGNKKIWTYKDCKYGLLPKISQYETFKHAMSALRDVKFSHLVRSGMCTWLYVLRFLMECNMRRYEGYALNCCINCF
jgi:hypothetical protein